MASRIAQTGLADCTDVFGVVARGSCDRVTALAPVARTPLCRHRRACGRQHRFSDGHLHEGPRAPPLCSASSRGSMSSQRRPLHIRRQMPHQNSVAAERCATVADIGTVAAVSSTTQQTTTLKTGAAAEMLSDHGMNFANHFVSYILADAVDEVVFDFSGDIECGSDFSAEDEDGEGIDDMMAAHLVGPTSEPIIAEVECETDSETDVCASACVVASTLSEGALHSHSIAQSAQCSLVRSSLAVRLAADDGFEDVLSIASDDDSFETQCAWALQIADYAVHGAMYDEGLIPAPRMRSNTEVAHAGDMVSEQDQETPLEIHETPFNGELARALFSSEELTAVALGSAWPLAALSTEELALDYVSGMLDASILGHTEASSPLLAAGGADDAAGPAVPQTSIPSARAVSPCTRRGFSRAYCFQEHPPVPAEPFPADCLPSEPVIVSPSNLEVNWSAVLLAARPSTAAAEEATRPQPCAYTAVSTVEETRSSLTSTISAVVTPAEPAAPSSPPRSIKSSRSKRRIIGGVVRPVTISSLSSKSLFRMDIDENGLSDSGAESGLATSKGWGFAKTTPESSIARNYNALGGADFYRIDTQDILEHRLPLGRRAVATQMTPITFNFPSASPSKASAMAQDLGEDLTLRSSFGPKPLGHVDVRPSSRSSSLGSLACVTKPSPLQTEHSSFLPEIQHTSSGSIAWSMQRARANAQRGSLATVF